MGKVKLLNRKSYENRLKKYQFPMGKVKSARCICGKEIELVSIPYGKGKTSDGKYGRSRFQPVSIPYGKGKILLQIRMVNIVPVSIPYGKGKEQHFVLFF